MSERKLADSRKISELPVTVVDTLRAPKRAAKVMKLAPPVPVQMPTQVFEQAPAVSGTSGAATTTIKLEQLPPRVECENCAELRRLLASMRSRVDEVEREYHLIMGKLAETQGSSEVCHFGQDVKMW